MWEVTTSVVVMVVVGWWQPLGVVAGGRRPAAAAPASLGLLSLLSIALRYLFVVPALRAPLQDAGAGCRRPAALLWCS